MTELRKDRQGKSSIAPTFSKRGYKEKEIGGNKNSAEVDIAPAFGEITTACNVGQAKKGHGA